MLDTETIEYGTDGNGVKDFARVLDRHQDGLVRPAGLELKDIRVSLKRKALEINELR